MFVPQVVDQFLRAGVELPLTNILMTVSNQIPLILVLLFSGWD